MVTFTADAPALASYAEPGRVPKSVLKTSLPSTILSSVRTIDVVAVVAPRENSALAMVPMSSAFVEVFVTANGTLTASFTGLTAVTVAVRVCPSLMVPVISGVRAKVSSGSSSRMVKVMSSGSTVMSNSSERRFPSTATVVTSTVMMRLVFVVVSLTALGRVKVTDFAVVPSPSVKVTCPEAVGVMVTGDFAVPPAVVSAPESVTATVTVTSSFAAVVSRSEERVTSMLKVTPWVSVSLYSVRAAAPLTVRAKRAMVASLSVTTVASSDGLTVTRLVSALVMVSVKVSPESSTVSSRTLMVMSPLVVNAGIVTEPAGKPAGEKSSATATCVPLAAVE